nr:hypothetical protein CFP56_71004 [Quercus suber]
MNSHELVSLENESLPTTSLLEVQDDGDQGPRPTILRRLGNLQAICWCLSAVISITTTKSILSRHFHYPCHLLLLHVSGALLLRALRNGIERLLQDHGNTLHANQGNSAQGDHDNELHARQAHTTWAWGLYVVGVSGALLCTYQAILHTPNFLLLLMVASLDWQPPFHLVGIHDLELVMRHLAFTSGVCVLYVSDFRLIPLGIILSLLLAGFAGITVLSQRLSVVNTETALALPTSPSQSIERPSVLIVSPSVAALVTTQVLTALLLLRYENPTAIAYSGSITSPTEIVVSVVASAVALESGCFIARPLRPFCTTQLCQMSSVERFVLGLAFTGATAAASSFHGILLHSSIGQAVGYSIASLAMFGADPLVGRFDNSEESKIDRLAHLETSQSHARCNSDWTPLRQAITFIKASKISPVTIFLLVLSIFSWLGALYNLNGLVTPPLSMLEPNIDFSYQPRAAFDIVVSYYEEPLDGVVRRLKLLTDLQRLQSLNPRVFVYSKSHSQNTSYVLSELEDRLPNLNFSVRSLPNTGREAGSYLHHIVEQWDELAKHTLFVQAEMHHDRLSLRRISDYFRPETGFLSIQTKSAYCSNCSDCYDRDWGEDSDVLIDLYRTANSGADCKNIVFTYKGQFIASAARIRGNSIQMYQKLLDDLSNGSSPLHKPSYTESPRHRGLVDSLNAPIFGFTLERMWGVLLQCSEMRIAERCPSLLSGMLSRVNDADVADCQCLDL